tara:strand:+ start:30 stop:323 length:294 start_codon:yes stop_codon:yes gene_type:complete
MSKDFFQRKEVQDGGFDDQNFDDDFEACGLEQQGFKEKYEKVFDGVEIDVVSKNPVVTLTQALYEGLTARELSFVVAKDIVAEIMDQAEQQLTEEEE